MCVCVCVCVCVYFPFYIVDSRLSLHYFVYLEQFFCKG